LLLAQQLSVSAPASPPAVAALPATYITREGHPAAAAAAVHGMIGNSSSMLGPGANCC
jgi:hypothetical protein